RAARTWWHGPLAKSAWKQGSGLALQVAGRDRAEAAGVVVLDRLEDLLARVHHERAVEDHRLPDRPPAEQEHVQVRRPRVLDLVRLQHDGVAGAEDGELALAERCALRAGLAGA